MKTGYFEETKRWANCRSTKIYEQLGIAEFRAAVCGPNQANPRSNRTTRVARVFQYRGILCYRLGHVGTTTNFVEDCMGRSKPEISKFPHFFRNLALFGLGNILSVIGKSIRRILRVLCVKYN